MCDSGCVDAGWVFNIQKFSLHDGPGIRDLVFMKGCPLRCRWCSNPESQRPHPEIAYNADQCIGFESCGLCRDVCPEKAILRGDSGRAKIDRSLCNNCGDCATVCPDRALEMIGREMKIAEILDIVSTDDGFHFRSGGGVTVGGGDPILQSDFVGALLSACRDRGIDTAIETAGFGQWDQLEKIGRYANLIFYDVKSMNTEKHKAFTGVSNVRILENLSRLSIRFPEIPIVARTSVIPGFNDTNKDISAIVKFLRTIKTLTKYELLPYHKFGTPKYRQLGKTYLYPDTSPPTQECMQRLRVIVDDHLTIDIK
ncbi:MAG: glycyl-radical enzyme activating protein [Deltaproteobacteria bacterium]|jgi:pyruvate formate lyase activating enzyme|nr:glycyl-radical enzyme activating protein [Deltaproteobacteria bacterium]